MTFSVHQGPNGFMEAYDIVEVDRAWHPLTPCGMPFVGSRWCPHLSSIVAVVRALLVLLVVIHLVLFSLRSTPGLRCSGIMAGLGQKDSIPRVCCARRRLRQWHVHGWFCRYFFPRAEFLSVVVRPKMHGILVSLDQKDSYTARLSPRSSSIWQCHVHGWFCRLRCISRCVPLSVGRLAMPGIMFFLWFLGVVSLVVNNGSGMFHAGFTGNDTLRAVFPCLAAGL